jgi:hypothetical protein
MPHRRSVGRPFGPEPLFVTDCVQFDAIRLLSRPQPIRRAAVDCVRGRPEKLSTLWTLRWTDGLGEQQRTVALPVTETRQRLGGTRRWWRCPSCGRRAKVLLAVDLSAPIGCRVCLEARYTSDYPARHRRRQFVALVRGMVSGAIDDDQELDLLLAPRRRGVRRGRRV